MEIKASKIITFLENLYPLSYQRKDDNSGIQLGSPDKFVRKLFVSYEKTLNIIEKCVIEKCDMLVIHRPLFLPKRFGPPPQKWWKKCKDLINNRNILIYAIHENLDLGIKSTNLILADTLNLTPKYKNSEYLICSTNPIKFIKLIERIKSTLSTEYIISVGKPNNVVKKIGIVAGTAMDITDIDFFLQHEIDCYLSGDPDDFGIRYANDMGIMTINVDDYSLERPAMLYIYKLLKNQFPKINVKFIDCRYNYHS